MLLELDYAQAHAVDKDSVDAEGALIAPAAANVEGLWFPVLDIVFLPDIEIKSAPRYSPTCRTTLSMA